MDQYHDAVKNPYLRPAAAGTGWPDRDAGRIYGKCPEVGGSLAFVVLRDFYGTTQLVVEDAELLALVKSLNKETTLQVIGVVRERSSKTRSSLPETLKWCRPRSRCWACRHNELPFEINRSREADETQRLRYRYLDLRNPAIKQNIVLRCNVVAALRKAMMEHDFLEITTPILTASSPKVHGTIWCRRKHPGMFYALPQAPQQFKQL